MVDRIHPLMIGMYFKDVAGEYKWRIDGRNVEPSADVAPLRHITKPLNSSHHVASLRGVYDKTAKVKHQ